MLQVTDLRKTYYIENRAVPAVRGVSFNIKEGDVYTLLGPSGCGKTTILRSIAGLEQPEGGEILLGGKTVCSSLTGETVPTHRRDIGMVFQSYAIWPHMTVYENVALPLRYRGGKHSKKEMGDLVKRALSLVKLEGVEERSATLLSGGQQQRVALARAMVYQPSLLLLDEPLSNLDARLRDGVRKELKELVKRLHLTILYVTHDQVEALSLSDRIAVMRDGVIVQEGGPGDVFLSPQKAFVAEFVGKSNRIRGVLAKMDNTQCTIKTAIGELQGRAPGGALKEGDEVLLLIRPESLKLYSHKPEAETNTVEAEVKVLTFTGALTECVVRCGEVPLDVQLSGLIELETDQRVYLHFPPGLCQVLPAGE